MVTVASPSMPKSISMPCLFCSPDRPILVQNEVAYAIADGFPVSPGHTLVIPKNHAVTIFDLSSTDYAGCFDLVKVVKEILAREHSPDGFNVGVNCGEAAGQSVWHAHIHVIPRYKGDVEHPRGGVRHVIPKKGDY